MSDDAPTWPAELYEMLRRHNIRQVCHVPDAGHAELIERCEADNEINVTTLTTEEEGVGLLAGAWLGGQRGVLLMQSSGVGNTINALALPNICKMPFVTIVTMRGEWGEFVPWQVPMGQATPAVLEAMGLIVYRADKPEEAAETVDAAFKIAYDSSKSVAVLLSQKLIGTKNFRDK